MAKKKVIVYNIILDEEECEAMFSEKGELLSYWFMNDAIWREEYFSEFMDKFGIKVMTPNSTLYRKFQKILKKEIENI